MKWETRYSSCEMIYIEVIESGVRSFLNSDIGQAAYYTSTAFLEGVADNEVGSVFRQTVLAEVKSIVKAQVDARVRKVPGV